MYTRTRKIGGSFMIALAVTQIYRFVSAVYGYFVSAKTYSFIWNYWVIGILASFLLASGITLLKNGWRRTPSLICLLAFIIFQGLTIYFYQISPLLLKKPSEKVPFDFSASLLFVFSIITFVLLLFLPKLNDKPSKSETHHWKKKWRIASFFFTLILTGAAFSIAVMVFLQFNKPSSKDALFFVNDFDGYFAAFCALFFFVFSIIWSKRQMCYTFAGILLGIGFIYISNYFFVDKMMRYLASASLKIGITEIRILGLQLIAGFSSLVGGISLLTGLKNDEHI